jgi:hypothetical protein
MQTSIKQANARPPYQSAAQLESSSDSSDSDEDDVQLSDFHPGQSGRLGGGGYERVWPANFQGGGDDLFMKSMYENYALEAADPDTGKPTGSFYMNEASTRAAAREVLGTHKGLSGANLDSYLNTYFAKAWGHFDVNRTGKVNPLVLPSFMRFLLSDQYVQL